MSGGATAAPAASPFSSSIPHTIVDLNATRISSVCVHFTGSVVLLSARILPVFPHHATHSVPVAMDDGRRGGSGGFIRLLMALGLGFRSVPVLCCCARDSPLNPAATAFALPRLLISSSLGIIRHSSILRVT